MTSFRRQREKQEEDKDLRIWFAIPLVALLFIECGCRPKKISDGRKQMSNFRIHFAYPWLLLLLIPAIFFALLPYFRLSKKYRRTRNRVVSFVLHTAVIVMSVCLLAGMTFRIRSPIPETK